MVAWITKLLIDYGADQPFELYVNGFREPLTEGEIKLVLDRFAYLVNKPTTALTIVSSEKVVESPTSAWVGGREWDIIRLANPVYELINNFYGAFREALGKEIMARGTYLFTLENGMRFYQFNGNYYRYEGGRLHFHSEHTWALPEHP